MSDAVKWALLIGILVTIIATIVGLPIIAQVVPALGYFTDALSDFVELMTPYVQMARSLVLILVPVDIRAFMWTIIKITIYLWLLILPIQFIRKIYSWIFK